MWVKIKTPIFCPELNRKFLMSEHLRRNDLPMQTKCQIVGAQRLQLIPEPNLTPAETGVKAQGYVQPFLNVTHSKWKKN